MELYRAKIYINFNIGVTLYFSAVRKCSREIFYLKKFLLACGTLSSSAILGCETCVIASDMIKFLLKYPIEDRIIFFFIVSNKHIQAQICINKTGENAAFGLFITSMWTKGVQDSGHSLHGYDCQ